MTGAAAWRSIGPAVISTAFSAGLACERTGTALPCLRIGLLTDAPRGQP